VARFAEDADRGNSTLVPVKTRIVWAQTRRFAAADKPSEAGTSALTAVVVNDLGDVPNELLHLSHADRRRQLDHAGADEIGYPSVALQLEKVWENLPPVFSHRSRHSNNGFGQASTISSAANSSVQLTLESRA
jgi:hypothetical protein